MVAKPVGDWSLAGQAVKFPASYCPILTCTACDLYLIGKVQADGRHVAFPDSS